MSKPRLHPLLRLFARLARERYGREVKLRTLPGREEGVLFIDFILPDGRCIDTLTLSAGKGNDPAPVYTREVTLQWQPGDMPESVLDAVEEIRTNTVRGYWKARLPKEES